MFEVLSQLAPCTEIGYSPPAQGSDSMVNTRYKCAGPWNVLPLCLSNAP